MRKIKNQILASTRIDSHGEKLSKEFLQSYCDHIGAGRIPLHQQHDMSKPTAGYIENLRLVPDAEQLGEWRVIGDVFLDEGQVECELGGFSVSGVEKIIVSQTATAFVNIPFPQYNDPELIETLTCDPELNVGKWINKAADPIDWVLLGSVLAFAITPVWDDIYKRKIAPAIDSLLAKHLDTLKKKGLSTELVQIIIFKEDEVEIRFIPVKGKEGTCLHSTCIKDGLKKVVAFLASDQKANAVGVKRIVVFYNDAVSSYELHRIEYCDGQVDHLA